MATADLAGPVPLALTAAGVCVETLPDATAVDLLALAADRSVVWLSSEDGDEELTQALAAVVVRRTQTAQTGPQVEIVVGSFDPAGARLLDAVDVMDVLRRECPWDREQTHESLLPYLVEETYEVVEAVESGRPEHLREELGDLLLQVLFHARLAAETAPAGFTIDEVAGELVDKLVRRHPHVFAGSQAGGVADVEASWETIKRTEKSRTSAMDGIPMGLPGLSLAGSVVDRAAAAGVVVAASGSPGSSVTAAGTEDELGETIFGLVAAARRSGIDAERALRRRVRQEMAAVRSAEQRAVLSDGDARR
ncbi:MAG: MazG family protein [Nocardioidaceae bacterium]